MFATLKDGKNLKYKMRGCVIRWVTVILLHIIHPRSFLHFVGTLCRTMAVISLHYILPQCFYTFLGHFLGLDVLFRFIISSPAALTCNPVAYWARCATLVFSPRPSQFSFSNLQFKIHSELAIFGDPNIYFEYIITIWHYQSSTSGLPFGKFWLKHL